MTNRIVGAPLVKREWLVLAGLLVAGLLLRLLFLSAPGHETDIGTFEAWTTALAHYGTKAFYPNTQFVDYPPGYMVVLWLLGQIYSLVVSNQGSITPFAFMALVKLPAIIADIGIAYLTYLLARRTWSAGRAYIACAIVAFNPAIWFVSAYWGQADSVAAVFLVWCLYLAVTERFEWAWVLLSVAVLIKPQPLVVWPLLLALQIRRQGLSWRLALIPLIALAVGYVGAVPFSPTNDPPHVWQWLYLRYHTGTGVYPYNSVNAFNLYSIVRDMWQPDTVKIFGIVQWVWGVVIFLGFTIALVSRQWRLTSPSKPADVGERGVYLAWFLMLLGLFILTTRMHERYMFSALALAPLIWNIGRTQIIAVVVLSITFLINLIYALQYLRTPSADLNPILVHSISLVNVIVLFVVAGAFLIEEMGATVERQVGGAVAAPAARPARAPTRNTPLAREGLTGLTPLDYALSLGLTIAAGILVYTHLNWPNSRVFDEVYFARAAHEYLTNQPQFEWTHPPLTKLILAAAAGIFHYLPDPIGARVGSAFFGVLTVPLLYAFARRLLASTGGAVAAVLLLMVSGYWYVQSRIATPEIFIAFFSLATLYGCYRLIIASQIVRPRTWPAAMPIAAAIYALLTPLAFGMSVFVHYHDANDPGGGVTATLAFALLGIFFAAMAVYSLARVFAFGYQKPDAVFPDGSRIEGNQIRFPGGATQPLRQPLVDGERTTVWRKDGAEVSDAESRVSWNADGTIAATIGGRQYRDTQAWLVWLLFTAVALACLVTSKWEGVLGLGAVWFAVSFVAGQRWLKGRWVWGNPFGVRWPLFIAVSIAVALVIYLVSYIPFFAIGDNHVVTGKGWSDLWDLQKQMYWYHHNLRATHPYSSQWWTWPLEIRPVSYYYQQITAANVQPAIVSEIIALPNPAVWLFALVSIPFTAWYAWRERNKGMLLLVAAYFLQWIPWALSPRIDFEYNMYPDLAIVCLCTVYVLGKWWSPVSAAQSGDARAGVIFNRVLIGAYAVACLGLFVFFFPILGAVHITYQQWMARMWLPFGVPHWYGWI